MGSTIRAGAIERYDEAAMQVTPHTWKAYGQTLTPLRQLERRTVRSVSMPLAPYERIFLIAAYFKQYKPRSKITVLDAEDKFGWLRRSQSRPRTFLLGEVGLSVPLPGIFNAQAAPGAVGGSASNDSIRGRIFPIHRAHFSDPEDSGQCVRSEVRHYFCRDHGATALAPLPASGPEAGPFF
jgi:hypothetical protein